MEDLVDGCMDEWCTVDGCMSGWLYGWTDECRQEVFRKDRVYKYKCIK